MAEIEITLPTVQYGNIKIRATPEEWGLEGIATAANVGVWAAVYLNLFQQGFQHGATLDVDAHLGASHEDREDKMVRELREAFTGTLELLNEGLGGVTELHVGDDFAKSYNDDGPGDVQAAANEARDDDDPEGVDSDPDAPWSRTVVDTKKKPWETSGKAPAAPAKIDW